MGGKIQMYYDCTSFYSWIAHKQVQGVRDTLATHDVTIEYIPIFLGGIMNKSGNQPPWKLPSKAVQSQFDSKRAQKHYGFSYTLPDFFPPLSILPQRCMTYVKENYPASKLEEASEANFTALYQDHLDFSKPNNMAKILARTFPPEEVKTIMQAANSKEYKDKLTAATDEALELGAFGAPWWTVTNDKGESEPFFGSDRWHYIYSFLGLPYRDVELLPKGDSKL